jgi:transposase
MDHPVRLLDEILDELDWNKWEAVYSGKMGQPSIHPSILCKVLLFALARKIRSSRQIEYAAEHFIDFIWLVSGRKLDHRRFLLRDHSKVVQEWRWGCLTINLKKLMKMWTELRAGHQTEVIAEGI